MKAEIKHRSDSRLVIGGALILIGALLAIGEAGYLQFLDLQGPMAVRADVFRARAAEQYVRPGTGKNGHAQAAQTGPATIALIPHDQP